MSLDLPLVFAGLMGLAILAYVVLDGYDLGVGMLMLWDSKREEHDVMIASIGPVLGRERDLAGARRRPAARRFPVAHGIVLGALYYPVVAMLAGLMARGVAFELRIKAEGWHRELWNWLVLRGLVPRRFLAGPDARPLHPRLRAGHRALDLRRAGRG
jgi:cytochrome d ubiquinol oxidase subunit II